MFRKILVPLDGASDPVDTLEQAQALALAFQAELRLISVESPVSPTGNEWKLSQSAYLDKKNCALGDYLERHAQVLRAAGCRVSTSVLPLGKPVTRVLDEAIRFKPDLIVLQSHGRVGLARMLMGSYAEGISRQSPCPVLLVHRAPTTSSERGVRAQDSALAEAPGA